MSSHKQEKEKKKRHEHDRHAPAAHHGTPMVHAGAARPAMRFHEHILSAPSPPAALLEAPREHRHPSPSQQAFGDHHTDHQRHPGHEQDAPLPEDDEVEHEALGEDQTVDLRAGSHDAADLQGAVHDPQDGDDRDVDCALHDDGQAADHGSHLHLDIDLDGDGDIDLSGDIEARGPVSIDLHLQQANHADHQRRKKKHHPDHQPSHQPDHQKSTGPDKDHPPNVEHHARDRRLMQIMKKHGIVSPALTLKEARKAGVHLALACAVLQAESSGGHNVFGSDPVTGGQVHGGGVTRQRYLEYKRLRKQGYGNQGVGPMQLTSPGLQDQADKLGGAWKPSANLQVGLRYLHDLIKSNGSTWKGLLRYNGAKAYADRVNGYMHTWHTWLKAAGDSGHSQKGDAGRERHSGDRRGPKQGPKQGPKRKPHGDTHDSSAGQDALHLARKQLGVHEVGVNGNKFSHSFGRPPEMWCADFVSWCFIHAGHDMKGKSGFSAVSAMASWFHGKGRSHFHLGTTKPHVGWVIFFDWSGARDWQKSDDTHVGIVSAVSGDTFTYIAGNTGHNNVGYSTLNVGAKQISGFGVY